MRACRVMCDAWYKDIGAQVQKGDLLATIDTPELDQQLEQAKADLANAVAAEKLSQSTSTRWNGLLALDAVSKQEADEKTGDLAAKTALVDAAKANVDRLSDLKNFARIVAPFDGTVTSRSVDIGALVNAGAQTSRFGLIHCRRRPSDTRLCRMCRRLIRPRFAPA